LTFTEANGRQLGLVPGEDSFRKLTQDEVREEQSAMKQKFFIKKVNEEVIPYIDWDEMKKAYQRNDMEAPIELLRMLHEDSCRNWKGEWLMNSSACLIPMFPAG
jgi:hypothetical protein